MQSKRGSLIEQLLNIGSGFVLAFCIWEFGILALIDNGVLETTDTLQITLIFTIVSIVRGYIWRRIFNRYLIKQLEQPYASDTAKRD